MNSGMTKDNLLYTLPSVLARDKGMLPLGDTIAEELQKLYGHVDLPTIYSHIDDLSEELLDILAQDFKVDWYDYNQTIEVKRQIIKDSFYVHRHLGTVGAVKRAISDVWSSFLLEEWFQYGGEPYHFRVGIADNDFTVAKREQAIKLINTTKNVRSWLDDIYTQTVTDIAVNMTTGYTFVDYLVASEIEYTNANDIGDWEAPQFETQDAQVDVTRVGSSRLAATGRTLNLPQSLRIIGDEAYVGVNAEVIICPSDCTTIQSRAFADCPNLRTIVITASTTSIASDAFEGDTDLTIQTPAGSYAETYAENHGFNVIH